MDVHGIMGDKRESIHRFLDTPHQHSSVQGGSALIPRYLAAMVCFALTPFSATFAAEAPQMLAAANLAEMSLEQLINVEVTSVSRKPQPLISAPAAVYVITREDIRRSGATSIPEILRLAPNLQVARVDSSQYAISARGFNSTTANKLLVLIDGRNVYTPLFSGVFWDVQDVMVENIERIEVISGVGATLWGSNAVNGVINIIRRKSSKTPGGLVNLGVGNFESEISMRYGAELAEDASYRIYGKAFKRDYTAPDDFHKGQIGFRADWGVGADQLTVHGDTYKGTIDQAILEDKEISGSNVSARWSRVLQTGSELRIQANLDHTQREYPGVFRENLNIHDIDVQHSFRWEKNHDLVWGGGHRQARDSITNSSTLAFLPAEKTLSWTNLYFQDVIALKENLRLTLGTRLERNTYTGFENQPNIRLAWNPTTESLIWASIARAVRTPSRVDREFYQPGTTPYNRFNGGPNFQSEKLIAYETGYRIDPSAQSSFSISAFYNDYDELRSLEPTATSTVFENKMEGHTYGIETWGNHSLTESWHLKAGYAFLKKDLHFESGSNDRFGVSAAGNDPRHRFTMQSLLDLAAGLDLNLTLRSVDALPDPHVPGYVAFDANLNWRVSKDLTMSLSGFNLLDKRHAEFGAPATRKDIGRSVYGKVAWDF